MVKITSDMFKLVRDSSVREITEEDNEEEIETHQSSEAYIKPDAQLLKEFEENHYILITKLNNDVDLDFHVKAKPMIGVEDIIQNIVPGTVTYSFKRVDDFEQIKEMFVRVVNKVSGERLQKELSGYDPDKLIWGSKSLKDYLGENREDVLNLWKSFKQERYR